MKGHRVERGEVHWRNWKGKKMKEENEGENGSRKSCKAEDKSDRAFRTSERKVTSNLTGMGRHREFLLSVLTFSTHPPLPIRSCLRQNVPF